MRIALITETFYPATDGICTRLSHMVEQLQMLGHELCVITPDMGLDIYKGVRVIGMPTIYTPLYASRPWGLPSPRVKKELLSFQPDIIHAVHPTLLGVSGLHYGKQLGIPILASYHTHLTDYLTYYKLPFLENLLWDYTRYCYQKADKVITVSQDLADILNSQGIPEAEVWQAGIDFSHRSPEYYDEALYQKLTHKGQYKHLLVYVGRLAYEKGIDQLRGIFEHRNDIALAIVGDGPARAELEQYFAGTPTQFLGFLEGEALGQAFAVGDAFIFPSVSETFGLVISEAMASGTPVIAAESGPTLEQLTPLESGLTFQNRNLDSLLQSLRYLDQPDAMQSIQANALKRVQGMTWQAAAKQLETFYLETIEQTEANHRKSFYA
ncbi:glycosyl transferase [Suicoccus acidiformans]|uniref:Glycosyl transferase n=1 Tax=Suicoccus acidiformans TaxID=2036206 RepID=A0A347WJ81_9LACT|nr:glycosyltransferase family 1 protein [Suicoccus acidiformans]AXY25138.1 glycosyl transferase [Suicoccus acidiformans]